MRYLLSYRLALGLYQLSLGSWVGALVMSFVAAAVTFATVARYEPTVGRAPYDDPAFADAAPRILAGAVANNIFTGMELVTGICAVVVLLMIVLQQTAHRAYVRPGWANRLRLLCIFVAIVVGALNLLYYDRAIWDLRNQQYDPQRTAAQRDAAHARLRSLHGQSQVLLAGATLGLIAAGLISPFALRNPEPPVASFEPGPVQTTRSHE